jgi:protein SCO1
MPLTDRTRRLVLPLVAFFVGLAALGAAATLTLRPWAGSPGTPSAVGGPFTLTDADGRTVTERDFRGRPYLVFFGFTHCPDICPTKLFEISEILKATGERGRDLRALFITVDPERDTPEVLRSYLGGFDPRIVGLTGSREAVDAAVRAFRAYAKRVPLQEGDYTMEHTSLVYLLDAQGRFVNAFNTSQPPEAAAEAWLRQS